MGERIGRHATAADESSSACLVGGSLHEQAAVLRAGTVRGIGQVAADALEGCPQRIGMGGCMPTAVDTMHA